MENETLTNIRADMRGIVKPGETITNTYELLNGLADRINAAEKRDAASIERVVRDAIIDYQEMYAYAPNDEVERDLIDRANRGNAWFVSHGYEPEKTIWDKEEAPCL